MFFNAAADAVSRNLEEFKMEVVQHVQTACSGALAELDQKLFGVRDGITADEVGDAQGTGRYACAAENRSACTNNQSVRLSCLRSDSGQQKNPDCCAEWGAAALLLRSGPRSRTSRAHQRSLYELCSSL